MGNIQYNRNKGMYVRTLPGVRTNFLSEKRTYFQTLCKERDWLSKRYYWLKLQDDFFSALKIKKLRKTTNGDLLTIIYLKMQLLSVKNGGVLQFEGVESSFEEELALALDEDIDSVRATLLYLQNHGMLQRLDGNRYLIPDAVRNVGSESDSAARMRKLRGKDTAGKETLSHCNADVRERDKNVTPDIEKDIDRDIEKDIDTEKDTEREGEKEKEGEGETPQPIAKDELPLPEDKQKFEYTNRFRPDGRPPAPENPYCRMQKRCGGMDSPFAGYLPIFQAYRQSVRDRNGSWKLWYRISCLLLDGYIHACRMLQYNFLPGENRQAIFA